MYVPAYADVYSFDFSIGAYICVGEYLYVHIGAWAYLHGHVECRFSRTYFVRESLIQPASDAGQIK